jgi:hypothetical protein
MDPMELLNERIQDFPGYGDDVARRRSDELVRSFLGEMLADLAARCKPSDPAVNERLGDLTFRAGFANQAVFQAYEAAVLDDSGRSAIEGADAAAVNLADVAAALDPRDLSGFLNEVDAAFDGRDAAMRAAATSTTPA